MNTVDDSLRSPDFRRLLDQCIHCGLCLTACPTYTTLGVEMDSPRGRIALMAAAADGRIAVSGTFQEHIDLCLGCRSCETACPSGVRYGALLETTRAAIQRQAAPGRMARLIRWLALRQLMPHPKRLRGLAAALVVAQALGLPDLAQRLGFLPSEMRSMAAILPPLDGASPNYNIPAPALGKRRGAVAFLHGCVQDAFLGRVNAATVRVLQRNGFEVHFPALQTCCGAAALHSGEDELARDLARRNIDACAGQEYDAIISNAGGCGAALKEYGHLLAKDERYAERAGAFAAKVRDINEFLADRLLATPQKELPVRVAYVDSCHLRHGQRVSRQPRALLTAIPGLTLVELRQPDMCCGSAGIYNITQSDMAGRILSAKMVDIVAAQVDVIVTSNTGCHMQMIYGAARAGLRAEVMHVVELLDRAYGVGAAKTEGDG